MANNVQDEARGAPESRSVEPACVAARTATSVKGGGVARVELPNATPTTAVPRSDAAFDIRRKLIKAVAGAAPLVVTLPVGAQTTGSSFGACRIKSAAEPPAVPVVEFPAGLDTWVRMRAIEGRLPVTSATTSAVFEILAWQVGNEYLAAEAAAAEGYAVGDVIPKGLDKIGLFVRVREVGLLAYVDADGKVTYYPKAPAAGTQISTSCWTSVFGPPTLGPG